MEIKDKLTQLFEESKTNHKKLKALKQMALKCEYHELAAELRGMENSLFPEPEEVKEAKSKAKYYNTLFRMVDLNIPDDISWLIFETISRYKKRRGNFDIQDASNLLSLKNKLFKDE